MRNFAIVFFSCSQPSSLFAYYVIDINCYYACDLEPFLGGFLEAHNLAYSYPQQFSGFFYICRYLFISHHNVFRNFRWNGRPFSSYCCGNVVEFSHVPTLIPRFVQCVTGLFRLLLACSLVVPLVTGFFLGCSACYWPVPCLFRLLLACSACSVF